MYINRTTGGSKPLTKITQPISNDIDYLFSNFLFFWVFIFAIFPQKKI